MMPKQSKKILTLAKQLHFEAIRVNFQRKVDRSSIADFKQVEPRSQNSLTIEQRPDPDVFMLAVPFLFRMHACTISNWAWSSEMQKKMKGQLVHLPTRIDSFILPRSSKLFLSSSLLCGTE
jgi:hypothetical protein